ncbi:2-hydroxyacid dehydrogenase [Sphingomonas taxi]|jgi:D-lactate dehydrogenase|uniref:2-hydroxyacid dehydrogenase n=1 Tax=Sphingomonas taxi TaxID=1549858 RepID=A0A097EC29_9SPHN|nr:2-hydroxyacid dehydrogenase [Sphingomonas taxi]AIT05121.1 2-hydroxyacid dehydrogenase [Sphingomonas taxi]
MIVTVFSTKSYDRTFMEKAAGSLHTLRFVEDRLTAATATLAQGSTAVCAFVNDQVDAAALQVFKDVGVEIVALRSAGFNNVDMAAAKRLGIAVARVPAYSPEAVSEHTVALILSLDRNIHRAYARVREGNFALEGLLGFNLHGRTVGIVGTGRVGAGVARIMLGFGCKVIAHDVIPNVACAALGVTYTTLDTLLAEADIVSLHCPLTDATRHLIDAPAIDRMKHGVMLINTSRGGMIDTAAVIQGLKSGRIGHLGLDVYEEEEELFFEDLSSEVIQDDAFERLLMFSNVLVTGHQGFFTHEALSAIAKTTMANLSSFETGGHATYQLAG